MTLSSSKHNEWSCLKALHTCKHTGWSCLKAFVCMQDHLIKLLDSTHMYASTSDEVAYRCGVWLTTSRFNLCSLAKCPKKFFFLQNNTFFNYHEWSCTVYQPTTSDQLTTVMISSKKNCSLSSLGVLDRTGITPPSVDMGVAGLPHWRKFMKPISCIDSKYLPCDID